MGNFLKFPNERSFGATEVGVTRDELFQSDNISPEYFHLQSKLSGLCLEVGTSLNDSSPFRSIHMSSKSDFLRSQRWRLTSDGYLQSEEDKLTLVARSDGRKQFVFALEASNIGRFNGGRVSMVGGLVVAPQENIHAKILHFLFTDEDKLQCGNLFLTLKDGNRTSRAKVWMNVVKSGEAQMWTFVRIHRHTQMRESNIQHIQHIQPIQMPKNRFSIRRPSRRIESNVRGQSEAVGTSSKTHKAKTKTVVSKVVGSTSTYERSKDNPTHASKGIVKSSNK